MVGYGENSGVKSVVDEHHDRNALPPAVMKADQNALPGFEDDAPLPADDQPKKAGRPKGARNRSTEQWRKFLLSQYQSPLVTLAETLNKSIEELARDLGKRCPPDYEQSLELFRIQLQCAKELAPYLHKKQPQASNNDGADLMTLVINTGATQQQVDDAGVMDIDFLESESEENQTLSENDDQNSNAADSNVLGESGCESEVSTSKPTD